jgi:DNA-directed RNA polymerase subunit delta
MKLKDMSLAELKLLSYTDITYYILKEKKQAKNTLDLFKRICELLEYDESAVNDKIGDYYTLLNNDKRFVILDDGKWDIRDNHKVNLSLDEDEDEDLEEEFEDEEDEDDDDEEEFEDEEDEDDDELSQLSIILDEDEE